MWKTVKLTELCEIAIGKTPSRSNPKLWDKEKTTSNIWLSIADLTSLNGRYISDSKEYVSNEGAALFEAVPKNTLVMSFKLSIGKLAFTGCELRTNEAIAALKIKDEGLITKEYLFHYLSSLNWDLIAGSDVKVKGKTLNKEKLKELKIVVPPLAEQQRIVAKLDAAFAEIDRAVAFTEAKIKNVDELITELVGNIDKEYDGKDTKLGDCVDLVSGYAFKSNEYTENKNDIPLLRGDNLNPQNIDLSNAKRIDKTRFNSFEKFSLQINDIVLGMDRPLISSGLRIAKLTENDVPSLLVQRVMRIRCNNQVDPNFLFFLLSSKKFVKHLVGEQTGLGVPHISGKTISSFQIKVPNFETQKKIASRLLGFFEKQDIYQRASRELLNNLHLLKSSILTQALQPPKQ